MPPNDPSFTVPPAGAPLPQRARPQVAKQPSRPARAEKRPSRKRWWRFTLVYLFLAAGVGSMAILLTMMGGPPFATLLLIGNGYQTDLATPHNAYGWNGLVRMHQALEAEGTQVAGNRKGLRVEAPIDLRNKKLDDVRERIARAGASNLVVFMSLHGCATSDKGEPYLVLDGKNYGGQSEDLLFVKGPDDARSLLGILKTRKNKKTLVLIDATQSLADWPRGMLHNDFIGQLQKLSNQIAEQNNLVIICSSQQNQRSWIDEVTGQTVFQRYVLEWLQTEAAGAGESLGKSDRRTAQALFEFLERSLRRWVSQNDYPTEQTPLLLPAGQEGTNRASKIGLPVVRGRTARPVDSLPLTDLKGLWEEYEQTRKSLLPPVAYTPHFWRQYTDTLIRAEQLHRAGDIEGFHGLRDHDLRQLKEKFNYDRPSASQGYSLPLASALGIEAVDVDTELARQFSRDLGNLNAEAWMSAMPGWVAKRKSENISRSRLASMILRRFSAGQIDVERGVDFVQQLAGSQPSGISRSTEAHLPVMYRHFYEDVKDTPETKQESLELLRRATGLRIKAEEVAFATLRSSDPEAGYPYSEQVSPWTKAKVQEADKSRRQAEDLLFASRDSYADARKLLEEADKKYEEAGQVAVTIREALRRRDTALAKLPYYAQWVVHLPGEDVRDRAEQLDKLASTAQELSGKLLEDRRDSTQVREIKQKSDGLRDQLVSVEEDYNNFVEDVSKDQKTTTVALRIGAALRTPFLSVEKRVGLLEQLKETWKGREPNKTMATVDPATVTEKCRRQSQELAVRQGTLAVAQLGDLGCGLVSGKNLAECKTSLERAAEPRAKNWEADIAVVGDHVGKCLREIARSLEKKQAGQEDLKRNEQLLRLIDGGAVPELSGSVAGSLQDRRRWLLHDLLCLQARRLYHDHWYDEQDPQQPYFQRAALACLTDVDELLKSAGKRPAPGLTASDEVRNIRQLLSNSQEFRLIGPPKEMDIIDASIPIRLPYKVQAPPEDALPGYPVFWELEKKSAKREKLTLGGELPPRDFPNPFQKADPGNRSSKVGIAAFFRGSRGLADTKLTAQLKPDIIVWQNEPPPMGGVAVRADKKTYQAESRKQGAITIVIDYSGSMADPDSNKERRIDLALGQLKKVLKDLPAGPMVSVWTFGQDKVDHGDAEGTVQRQYGQNGPRAWDGTAGRELQLLEAKLNSITPMGWTPLVRGMVEAIEDLKKPTSESRTLLVLTDGKDTVFERTTHIAKNKKPVMALGDTKYNMDGSLKIPQFLREYFGKEEFRGIRIRMVFFDVDPDELREAKSQFRAIEDLDPLNNRLYDTRDVNLLGEHLKESLEQDLHYRLKDGTGKPVPRPERKDLGRVTLTDTRELDWFDKLRGGDYKLGAAGTERDVRLEAGDYMLLEMHPGLRYERSLLADFLQVEQNRKVKIANSNWQVGVLQCQAVIENNSLQMLVSLEDHVNRSDMPLRHIRPNFAWFELRAGEAKEPVPLRWSNEAYYPAPTFGIDTDHWPRKDGQAAPASLQVWLSSEQPRYYGGMKLKELSPSRTIEIGAQQISVVSNSYTVRTVGPGKGHEERCLVIELQHPLGSPVMAQFLDAPGISAEHRFYPAAKKYMGIFWKVEKDTFDSKEVSLISINEFKSKARHGQLPAYLPNRNDQRPRPAATGAPP